MKHQLLSLLLSSSLTLQALCFAPGHIKPTLVERQSMMATLKMSTEASTETETETNPRKEGLALQLDDGTRKSHSVAQNTAFVRGFFKGLSNRDSYTKLLTNLYFVYAAMEDAFDSASDEFVLRMDVAELRRSEALKVDMEYFYGKEDWQSKIRPSRAAEKYVERIKYIAENEPKLLIAHQYTRYLGDLFGGQMMGNMATKSLGLNDGNGIAFYQFDDIDDTTDFITFWYRELNTLDISDEEKEAIVDEANLVFELNIDILEELEGSAFQAVFMFAWKSFKERIGLS